MKRGKKNHSKRVLVPLMGITALGLSSCAGSKSPKEEPSGLDSVYYKVIETGQGTRKEVGKRLETDTCLDKALLKEFLKQKEKR